jgi:NADPH:quinone reductase-like Zn-dependent oxidoreductase
MRAAVLSEYGVPGAGDFEEPSAGPEQAVVDVLAAGLNPVDVAICGGRFYAGRPPLPSVAGREGVGMLDAARVYFDAPIPPFGSMAERALIDPRSTYPVPDGLQDGVAVALGISGLAAWLR